jgi:hypothetical protein
VVRSSSKAEVEVQVVVVALVAAVDLVEEVVVAPQM